MVVWGRLIHFLIEWSAMDDLVDLFGLAAQEMLSSVEQSRAALTHNLSIGEANESVVREFLRQRLPASIGVGRGQIVDKNGQRTRQLDVVLYDAFRTPALWTDKEKDQRLFPSESVVAVVEVRTHLRASDAESIVRNMRSVKILDKSSYYGRNATSVVHVYKTLYGNEYELPPTLYFVFAFESGELGPIRDSFIQAMEGYPMTSQIDCLVSLNSGVMCWCDPARETINAIPDGTDWRFVSYNSEHALLMFYILISRYLFQLRGGEVNLKEYLPKMNF